MFYLCIFVGALQFFTGLQSSEIVVGTYNLWNVMFHWEVRKLYIAEMIQESGIDIIGLQEVRSHKDLKHSQIDELQTLLPQYKYKYFHPVHAVQSQYNQPPGWEWEGVGFLSKHKLIKVDAFNLTKSSFSVDDNQRVVLYAQFFLLPHEKKLNVALVHFSYDKLQQCSNAFELLKYLYANGVSHTVLLGDFNTYEEYHWPVNALSHGYFDEQAPDDCKTIGHVLMDQKYRLYGYNFFDAWATINPDHPGYTFSNMPVPGFINRPDRIMVSNDLEVRSVFIIGKGYKYAQRYSNKLWWTRFQTVYQSTMNNQNGVDWERTCAWDCGPHGSCRCGVCVRGGNKNNCKLSQCTECTSSKSTSLKVMVVLASFCVALLVLALVTFILGIVRPRMRRTCLNRLKLRCLVGKYPVICSMICLTLLIQIVRYEFDDFFETVSSQLYEELHPSDHLMVVSTLKFA